MSKNRPYIPPPKMTPPNQVNAADIGEAQSRLSGSANAQPLVGAVAAAQQAIADPAPGLMLASVPAPMRPASIKILPDRVEFTNPTIDLSEYVWLKHEPVAKQTNKLTPDRAVVAHGLLIIEEYRLAIPLDGARIRT